MNLKLELPGTEILRPRREPSLRVHIERERCILAQIATGHALSDVLQGLVQDLEALSGHNMVASILRLSEDGKRLHHLAAPSLPSGYKEAIDGTLVGEGAGSCGTVVHRGKPVYVSDIATDPLWQDYRDLALKNDLRACWSTPIKGMDGTTLGTFAIYYDAPRSPRPRDIEAIAAVTLTVALAIERDQTNRQLLRAREELNALRGKPMNVI